MYIQYKSLPIKFLSELNINGIQFGVYYWSYALFKYLSLTLFLVLIFIQTGYLILSYLLC